MLRSAKLEAADVPVGPRKDDFMNTVVGGPADGPALVMIPGQFWPLSAPSRLPPR